MRMHKADIHMHITIYCYNKNYNNFTECRFMLDTYVHTQFTYLWTHMHCITHVV